MTMGVNTQSQLTVGPALYVSLGPFDGVGGGFHVGAALGRNIGMTMVTALGVSMGPPDGVGYRPGEGT